MKETKINYQRKRTKIVATISDRKCDVEFLREAFARGINVARLNTAHMPPEGITNVITNVRAVSSEIAVMLDTKGPEVRTTVLEDDLESCQFNEGDNVLFMADTNATTSNKIINVNYEGFVNDVPVGSVILLDDGKIGFKVVGKTAEGLATVCQNAGALGSRKSVNVPGVRIDLPSLTTKDYNNIIHSLQYDIEFIAHSFVRNAVDIKVIRRILDEHNAKTQIIAKIENQEGIDNIDEIIRESDGIMIARGDLAVEVPYMQVPAFQRMIIRKCKEADKPVIVATEMLHTMQEKPRPTRAEVSDVANAVYLGTDATMLSGESANGNYKLEAIQTMSEIILFAEEALSKEKSSGRNDGSDARAKSELVSTTTGFLAKAAVESASSINTEVIITDSNTGRTARHLAGLRPEVPVCAICYDQMVARQLSLSYAVKAHYVGGSATENALLEGINHFKNEGLLTDDTQVAYLSGKIGATGAAHTLEIEPLSQIIANHTK